MAEVGIVLLAAGGSRRMGQPKQLLLYRGMPLLRSVVTELAACEASDFVVVLGHRAPEMEEVLRGLPVRGLVNEKWADGMAGSIQKGIQSLPAFIRHALIALSDQPYLKAHQFRELLKTSSSHPEAIVAARANHVLTAPMIFPRKFFPQLMQMEGDQGAGKWVRKLKRGVIMVDMPEAGQDWDRPEDIS